MQKRVFSLKDGVNISFTGEVRKENIVKMVQNCQTGKCGCMSDETKQKIKNIDISGEDGDVNIILSGSILKEEIEEAIEKSKVING